MALGRYGAGRGGAGVWLLQRISGLLILGYAGWLILELAFLPAVTFEVWRGLFLGAGRQAAFLLFVLALCWHAWLGSKNVIMDYVKPLGLRLVLLNFAALSLLASAIWAGLTLLELSA